MFNNIFLNGTVYEMWKNKIQPDRSQMTIWRTARRITKATNPHSEYVKHTAFPLLQWSQEHVSLLGSIYTACLVII
jgi:hypothetical protein